MKERTRFDQLRLWLSLAGGVGSHGRIGISRHSGARIIIDYGGISFYAAFIGSLVHITYCFAGGTIGALLGIAAATE